MSDQFEWKAEITFKGTAEEFSLVAGALGEMHIAERIKVDIFDDPCKFAGCWPMPVDILLTEEKLSGFTQGMPRIQLKPFPDFPGGLRNPHIHLGEEVVLLTKDRFKVFVGEVANTLISKQIETIKDHAGVMSMVNRLAEGL